MKVLNKHKDVIPADAVYVGRGSKWGNPFSHLPSSKHNVITVSTREEAIRQFEFMFLADPNAIALAKAELKGKNLVCFCAPLACHADVLMKVANED